MCPGKRTVTSSWTGLGEFLLQEAADHHLCALHRCTIALCREDRGLLLEPAPVGTKGLR